MRFLVFLLAFLIACAAGADLAPTPPTIAGKSWLLLDVASGQTLADYNADERIEPASLTKLMTAYVAFSALKQKTVSLEQNVPVSTKAWKAPGSRMFIEPNKPVTVEQLLHGVIVQSGNDASIALAELLGGSEELFAQMMNREAQRLGMKNTSFTNSTGLPDPGHYSTARDLAVLAGALIRDFPDFYRMYSVKEYSYNNIKQPNRNRLLWSDPTVDGVKTGHTEAAGYCLIASAQRGSRRLISVVLGTSGEGIRAQESQKLLNFGFQFFDAVRLYGKGQAVSELKVWKGADDLVPAGFQEDFVLTLPKGAAEKVQAELVSQQPLMAPVHQGQPVGTLKLTLDGQPYGEYQVVALEEVPVGNLAARAWDSIRLWFE